MGGNHADAKTPAKSRRRGLTATSVSHPSHRLEQFEYNRVEDIVDTWGLEVDTWGLEEEQSAVDTVTAMGYSAWMP